ncbi:MAG: PTS sugar transporter subunit IIC [Erysipelotrichaceae bacterium]
MNKALDKLQNFLIPFSQKINNNKVLKGISGGFSAMLPVVMVGAIFTLLSTLNIAPYQTLITNLGLKQLFAIPAAYTTDMIALYTVFCIARAEAKVIGMDDTDSVASGIIALMFFLILIPLGVSGKSEAGEVVQVASALNIAYLGSKGLFTAMILGCTIPYLHNIFIKYNITIKLPESVPDMISRSFAAMIPAICIGFVAVLVRFGFSFTPWGTLTDAIYAILKAPLASLTGNPVTYTILLLVCNLLWFFGIHGGMVANAFNQALFTAATLENLAAYGAGQALPNITTTANWFAIGNIGGSGCAAGLVMCLIFFARSKRYKALGKVAIPAGLCSISEPMVFGIPLVLNPVMFIPMIVAPIVTLLLGYGAMALGLINYTIGVALPNGTPLILGGFIAFGGIKGAILQAVLIAVSMLIYLPFFKMLDKQALAEEAGSVE